MLIKKVTKKETPPKKRQQNENILEDGEVNEHEQNDYENGIEDDVVCSDDEQNVRKSENQGEQQEEKQEEQQEKNKMLRKLNKNRCQRRSSK